MSDAHPARVADDPASEPTHRAEPRPRRAVIDPDRTESHRSQPTDPAEPTDAADPTEPAGAAEEPLDGTPPLSPGATENSRPSRPPIVPAHADVVEHTRPGRVQVASERFWTAAIVLGIVGILTALVTHGHAVDELTAKAHPGDPEQVRRAAANILHFTMIGIVAAGLIPEAILATFLGGRKVVVRVVLSALALGATLILPLALEVLGPSGWRGAVIQICVAGHAALAIIASVLMWLPKGRRVKKK